MEMTPISSGEGLVQDIRYVQGPVLSAGGALLQEATTESIQCRPQR